MSDERDVYAEAGEVTCSEAREIADRYNNSHWRGKQKGEEARYTIPADPRRDDDIRLEAFIRRAEDAFKRLADAERDLELLAKVRAHPACRNAVSNLANDRDLWARWSAAETQAHAQLLGMVVELLSPGDANGGG